MGGRVDEGGSLENYCTARYPGFESRPIRFFFRNSADAGPHSMSVILQCPRYSAIAGWWPSMFNLMR